MSLNSFINDLTIDDCDDLEEINDHINNELKEIREEETKGLPRWYKVACFIVSPENTAEYYSSKDLLDNYLQGQPIAESDDRAINEYIKKVNK